MATKNQDRDAPPARATLGANYWFVTALSWLLPGAGHWLLGYRVRAAIIAVSLLGLFWAGETVLAENMAVSREVHPIFFCLQAGNGFSAFVANGLWGQPQHAESQIGAIQLDMPVHLNLGILLCSVSGLLNALVVLHVADPRTWREAEEVAAAGGSPGGSNGEEPRAEGAEA